MAIVGVLTTVLAGNNAPLMASLASSQAGLKAFAITAGTTTAMAAASLAGIGLIAGLVGVKAVQSASTFEDAMLLIETQAGGTRAEVETMTTALLRMAPSLATGPVELAEALYRIESTGHRGADALDILTTSAKLAKVGNADLEDTTNALLAAQNSGIGGFTGMGEAAGILNSIVGSGNMRMEELTGAIGTGLLSRAAAFGVTLQGVGASLATMTAAGLPAQESATKLGMTLALLGAPTPKAIKELAKIGLTSTDLATALRGPNGVLGAVQMLRDHLEGLSDTDQAALLTRAFGGGRSSGTILALLGLIEQFPIIQQSVIDGAGNLDAAWQRTSEDASFRLEQIGVSIDVVVKAIGLALLPAVEGLLGAIVPVVIQFAQWTTDNPALASNILMVVAAVGALSAAALLLGPVIGVIAALANPLGLAFLAIAAAIALVVTNMDAIRAGIQMVSDAVVKFNAEHGGTPLPPTSNFGPSMPASSQPPPARGVDIGHGVDLLLGMGGAAIGGLGDQIFRGGRPESRPLQINNNTTVVLDGEKVGSINERRLYNDASTWSSGFSNPGPNPIR